MTPRLTLAGSVFLLCWVFVAYVASSGGVAAETLRAARELCMDGGQLLLSAIALVEVRVILAVSLPPLLLAVAALIASQFRARALTAELSKARIQPLPVAVESLAVQLGIAEQLRIVGLGEPFAFCAGLLRPRIFLSTGLLDRLAADELEAVLRHEAWHVSRRDPLFATMGVAARRGLFFLPRSGELIGRVLAAREIQADDAAITAMGSPYPLASALHKALHWSAATAPSMPGGFSAIDARIDHLLASGDVQPTTQRRRMLATGLLASTVLVLIVCGVTAASSAAGSVPAAVCGAC